MEELLPCPFCGLNNLNINASPSRDGTIIWYRINHGPTINCGISMIHDEKDVLIEQWNTRIENGKRAK